MNQSKPSFDKLPLWLNRNAIQNARVTRETKLIIIIRAYLDDSTFSGDLENLTFPGLAVSELDVHNLSESI